MSTGESIPVSGTSITFPTSAEPPKKNLSKWVGVVIGIIVALGGLFLLLAAHKVLPYGVNAISQWGVMGQVASYTAISMGVAIAFGSLLWMYYTSEIRHPPHLPIKVQTALKSLFGQKFLVSKLPVCRVAKPTWKTMTAPIMIGREEGRVFLALRLQNPKTKRQYVYRLIQAVAENPNTWIEEKQVFLEAPHFINGNVIEEGRLTSRAKRGIWKLNARTKNKITTDLNGNPWKLI